MIAVPALVDAGVVATPDVALAVADSEEEAPAEPPMVRKHRFLEVLDFSEGAFFVGAIIGPGLPAYDPATRTVAVAYQADEGLPNQEIWTLSPKGARKLGAIPVWSQKQSSKVLGDEPTAEKVKALVAAIDKRIDDVERTLGGYTTIPPCIGAYGPPDLDGDGEPDGVFPICSGKQIWTCGDKVFEYPRAIGTQGEPISPSVAHIKVGGRITTVSTKAWVKAPIQIYEDDKPSHKVHALHCVTDARMVPGTNQLLVQLVHICNISGDWCDAGGATWQTVTMP